MTELGRSAQAGRPFVTLNVATSADGKLAPIDGGKVNFGSPEDRAPDGSSAGGGGRRVDRPAHSGPRIRL